MNQLTYQTLKKTGNKEFVLEHASERVLQFGLGNFLRGFVDYFIDILNETQGFNGKVVLAQPIETGPAEKVNAQEGLYQLYLRGIENGQAVQKRRLISCVSRAVNPYEDYRQFLQIAHNPDLRFIVSNTTEAGIVFDESCGFYDEPPKSFPAKLTRFLFERYTASSNAGGFILLPCELIDNNGGELKKIVLKYAEQWGLDRDFTAWLEEKNIFCNTLVDRIVTGYPKDEALQLNQENGFSDTLLDTAETFGLWVIEGPRQVSCELPFQEAGLPVIFTNDHTQYKRRKVRILNGAHTSMALAAYLSGEDVVRDCMKNPVISRFIRNTILTEIIPTLALPEEELQMFADAVMERFQNPYINHKLLDISLNSVPKWKARVLPTLTDYYRLFGYFPKNILFSLSALVAFYGGTEFRGDYLVGYRNGQEYLIKDSPEVLHFFAENNQKIDNVQLIEKFAGQDGFFGEDLTRYPGFTEKVADVLSQIQKKGMKRVLDESDQNR